MMLCRFLLCNFAVRRPERIFRYANNIVPHDIEFEEERLTGWKIFLYKGHSAGKIGKIGWSVMISNSEDDRGISRSRKGIIQNTTNSLIGV
ncbi:MAG: hypothetical protein LDL14_02060, partial [Nitrospira sp.]|nr:hypothetical protein [Nitrospira sp.]